MAYPITDGIFDILLILGALACTVLAFLIRETRKVNFLKEHWSNITSGFGLIFFGRLLGAMSSIYQEPVFDFFQQIFRMVGIILLIIGLSAIRSNSEILVLKRYRASHRNLYYFIIFIVSLLVFGMALAIAKGIISGIDYVAFTQEAIIFESYLILAFICLGIKDLKKEKSWDNIFTGFVITALGSLLDVTHDFWAIAILGQLGGLIVIIGRIFLIVGFYSKWQER